MRQGLDEEKICELDLPEEQRTFTRREALAWAGPCRRPTRLVGMRTAVQVVRNQGAPQAAVEHQWWTA